MRTPVSRPFATRGRALGATAAASVGFCLCTRRASTFHVYVHFCESHDEGGGGAPSPSDGMPVSRGSPCGALPHLKQLARLEKLCA